MQKPIGSRKKTEALILAQIFLHKMLLNDPKKFKDNGVHNLLKTTSF